MFLSDKAVNAYIHKANKHAWMQQPARSCLWGGALAASISAAQMNLEMNLHQMRRAQFHHFHPLVNGLHSRQLHFIG